MNRSVFSFFFFKWKLSYFLRTNFYLLVTQVEKQTALCQKYIRHIDRKRNIAAINNESLNCRRYSSDFGASPAINEQFFLNREKIVYQILPLYPDRKLEKRCRPFARYTPAIHRRFQANLKSTYRDLFFSIRSNQ